MPTTSLPAMCPQPKRAPRSSFFEAYGSTIEIDEFTPFTFAANDNAVLTIVRCRARARATQQPVDMHLHHFRFRGDKVSYHRGTEDSAQTGAALRP